MLILKAFKFELMPNGAQVHKLKQFCGCSRFVFKIANLLPEWKRELVWLPKMGWVRYRNIAYFRQPEKCNRQPKMR
ncbi:helix-turn-helix domain-containing protein [Kingella negevensis]|uniref:helix-turn-helix domain-containing protein n=1 Tax=Kingella negevensis TaxID=1522312 RepID=UPI0025513AA3|nr:helix-turn-helix domain-containing protein [Kingella negevensis]MDK4707907.1 helix-turn-helix domain-containing protein [Kingella negevensis]